jgi:hypothetical protein
MRQMAEEHSGIQDILPDELLGVFSRTGMGKFLALAVVIHVALIGGTSVGYIRDRLDPVGAAERRKQEEAAHQAAQKQAGAEPASAAAQTASTEGTAVTQGSQGDAQQAKALQKDAGDSAVGTESKILEARKETPMVKRLTEVASPKELPKKPNDLGISIEDTNKF